MLGLWKAVLALLDLVYTGAFLDREVSQRLDYTGYSNIGRFCSWYQCEYLVGPSTPAYYPGGTGLYAGTQRSAATLG